MTDQLQEQLQSLPAKPGVYLFKDKAGDILYVGKAKNLRARVNSYFRKEMVVDQQLKAKSYQLKANEGLDPAKQQMIPLITNLEIIITDTENEALILEANLIRQHKPPYNVVLTDDKHYLFIKITNEEYPRVFPVRRIDSEGDRRRQGSGGQARYFGPYSSARAVRQTLKLLRRIFPYRAEKESPREKIFPHPLFDISDNQAKHLAHPSLAEANEEIHPGPAGLAPSERAAGEASASDWSMQQYQENIAHIIRFLQGDRQSIINTLREGMKAAAQAENYERAAIFRDQLDAIERLEGHQKVYLPRQESFDVISIATQGPRSAANIFAIRKGKLLNKSTFLLKHRTSTAATDIVRQFILQYYAAAQDIPNLLFIPTPLPDQALLATWIKPEHPPTLAVPQRGIKRQLLEMGVLNAQQLLQTEAASFNQAARLSHAIQELATALHLPSPPRRIETYDISNIQGKHATGSMIVFSDGQPDRSQYRKFRITGQSTPNDFKMIQEVLTRRFSHRHTDWKLPDLIIIDGGKGQLSAAKAVLDQLTITIPLVALAKREEELFAPKQADPIRLPYDSDALYLLQRMRDEAHRFTITYHRLLRSKQSQRSLLDEVPGIGPATKKKLLNHFGSLKAIRAASYDDLAAIIGHHRAKTLQEYL